MTDPQGLTDRAAALAAAFAAAGEHAQAAAQELRRHPWPGPDWDAANQKLQTALVKTREADRADFDAHVAWARTTEGHEHLVAILARTTPRTPARSRLVEVLRAAREADR